MAQPQPATQELELLRLLAPSGRLTLPLDGGAVLAGDALAASLTGLLKDPLFELSQLARRDLSALAQYAGSHWRRYVPPHAGGRIHPAMGLTTKFPLFSALIQHRDNPPDYHWLQRATLEWLITPRENFTEDQFRRLSQLVCTQLPPEDSPIRQVFQLVTSEIKARRIPGVQQLAELTHWGQLSDPQRVGLATAISLLTPLTFADPAAPLAKGFGWSIRVKPPQSTRLRTYTKRMPGLVVDLVEQPLLVTIPSAGGEESDGESIDELPGNLSDQSPALERWKTTQWVDLHLAGQIQPETNISLTNAECAHIYVELDHLIEEGLGKTPAQALAGGAIYIMGLTGRPRKQVLAAMQSLALGLADPHDPPFSISAFGFTTTVPNSEKFDARSAQPDLVHPTQASLVLPFPDKLGGWLGRLSTPAFEALWRNDASSLGKQFDLVRDRLKSRVTPRFVERRWRQTLAVSMFVDTQDLSAAQIVTGSTLDHSGAPLHYYATETSAIVDAYKETVQHWLLTETKWRPVPQADNSWVGAPLAAMRDDVVSDAVGALARLATGAPSDWTRLEDAINAHNYLTAWTASMFVAASTHRMTFHFGTITRAHLLTGISAHDPESEDCGIALIVDKLTDNGLSYRPVALPNMVCEQQNIYANHLVRLRRYLLNYGSKGTLPGAEVVERMLSGHAPLFQLLKLDQNDAESVIFHHIHRRNLAALWPEWPFEIYAWRHRFMSACGRGSKAGCDDKRRQMGHSADGAPFDELDPDSCLAFAKRMSKPLEHFLSVDGWRPISPQYLPEPARIKAVELPIPTADVIVSTAKALDRRIRKKLALARILLRRHRRANLNRFEDALDKALNAHLGYYDRESPPKDVELSDEAINQIAAGLNAQFESQSDLLLINRAFRRRILRLKKKHGWKCALPKLLFERRISAPVITPPCADALRWCNAALTKAEAQLEYTSDAESPVSALCTQRSIAAVILILVIRGGLTSKQRLYAVLRNRFRALPHPTLPGVLEVPLAPLDSEHSPTTGQTSTTNATRNESPENAASTEIVEEEDDIGFESAPAKVRASSGSDAPIEPGAIAFSGLAALALQSAAKHWPQNQALDEGTVNQLLKNLIEESDGPPAKAVTADAKSEQCIDRILTVAALARRITQPGVRSAWEDGRLKSATLPIHRLDQLRVNSAAATGSETLSNNENTRLRRARKAHDAISASREAEFLRNCRRKLFEAFAPGYRPTSAKRLAKILEQDKVSLGRLSGTGRLLHQYLCRSLKEITNRTSSMTELSSLYSNYTTVLEQLLESLAGKDILLLDEDSLTGVLIETIRRKPDDNQYKTYRVLRDVLQDIESLGGASPDFADIQEYVELPGDDVTPYIVTKAECEFAIGQLKVWEQLAPVGLGASGTSIPLAIDYRSARILLNVQIDCGTRISEAGRLETTDVVELGDDILLDIHNTLRRHLKTPASARPYFLKRRMDSDGFALFRDFARNVQSIPAGRQKHAELFARPNDSRGITDLPLLSRLITEAFASVTPIGAGRAHVGRRVRGNAGYLAVAAPELTIAGLPKEVIPEPIRNLPLRYQLAFIARGLGHSNSRTTLIHYIHLIGLVPITDAGFHRPTTKAISGAAAMRGAAVRKQASRAEVSLTNPPRLIEVLLPKREIGPSTPTPAFSRTLPNIEGSLPLFSLQEVTALAEALLEGRSQVELAFESGVPSEHIALLEDTLRSVDRQYKCNIFGAVRQRGKHSRQRHSPPGSARFNENKSRRKPRFSAAQPVLEWIEREHRRQPQVLRSFLTVLEAQESFSLGPIAKTSAQRAAVDAFFKDFDVEDLGVGSKARPGEGTEYWLERSGERGDASKREVVVMRLTCLLLLSANRLEQLLSL